MKSTSAVMGLMTLALLAQQPAEAGWKRKKTQPTETEAVADALTPSLALMDLNKLPPPEAGPREVRPMNPDDEPWSGGTMSTSMSLRSGRATAESTPVQVASIAPGLPSVPMVAVAAPALVAASPAVAVLDPTPNDAAQRFDLVVNNAPAAQVFLQLGSGSHYNMLVPPDITGKISVSLRRTTVPEALEALRELYGYDFRIAGNRVFVYPNTVQTRIFKINYLPGRRQGGSDLRVSSTSIASATKAGGAASGGSSSGASASSSAAGAAAGSTSSGSGDDTAHVRMTTDADFWRDVKTSLTNMVGTAEGRSVVLNPAAGVAVIRATPAELRHAADYLRAVQLTIERQVMLEAKIIEVTLKNESQSGVNWSLFRGVNSAGQSKVGIGNVGAGVTLNQPTGNLVAPGVTINPGTSIAADTVGKGFYGLAFQAANFSGMLNFLETQGEVQVLSSPRIATLNNQKAVLKVGSDELYVTNVTAVNSVTSTSNNNNVSNAVPTVELKPFFSGIVLDVTPQIDGEGVVMLHVHPSISVVTEKQKSLSLGLSGSYTLPLPVASINETDSIVRVRDGQIVAIGGLMTQQGSADRSGVPGLSEVPVMGGLFRQKSSGNFKRELVVLIKPTVISEDGAGWSGAEPATPMLKP